MLYEVQINFFNVQSTTIFSFKIPENTSGSLTNDLLLFSKFNVIVFAKG